MFAHVRTTFLIALTAMLALSGCAEDPAEVDDAASELAMLDGEPLTDVERLSQEGKEDGLGVLGPQVGCCAETNVWDVRNQWAETDTAAARAAGLAWGADSGLNWEEKYRLWVASLEPTESERGGLTFELTNPWGKTMPAPVLECAEVAYFLRASFSAWYQLPFFAEARDAQGPLYLGHFGFVRGDGTRHTNSPRFANLSDFSGDYPHGTLPGSWPSDSSLRSRGLYGGGDEVPFLGEGARAGAYFDEMFLNKRVGYFFLTLLTNFGSVHLADTTMTYHVKAESLAAGDVLIERWQRRGIGHTVPVLRVNEIVPGRFEAWVASGSMPRRQPVWETPQAARRYFTNNLFGGVGESSDGEAYAALGGGLRRWRVAVPSQGRWRNTVSAENRDAWINSGDLDSLSARVDRFENLLATVGPEEQREVLLQIIESKREHLSRYPSSCSARTAREEAFDALYALSEEHFGQNRSAVDAAYRTLADYVFAELAYTESRTCCWNSSTADMYRIAMDYNRELNEDACAEPVVFMMRDGAYDVFRDYAVSRDEGDLWVTWSADESCPQAATVTTDTEAAHDWTTFCALTSVVDPEPAPDVTGCADGNDSRGTATPLETTATGSICAGDEDFFSFTLAAAGRVEVLLDFADSDGDLELELLDSAGSVVRSSTTGSDDEEIAADLGAGTYALRVWGYRDASNTYTITVTLPTVTPDPSTGDDNDTLANATELAVGTTIEAAIDSATDVDVYRVQSSDFTAVLAFVHANGDLDLELLDAEGTRIGQSQGTTDSETVAYTGAGPAYVRVIGYSGAMGAYTLRAE